MTDFPPNSKDFTPFCKNMDALIDFYLTHSDTINYHDNQNVSIDWK